MEPVDIMQEVQINKEEALFQNKPTDQLVMENQQEQLQQAATLEMQRKESILDQFSKKIPSHSLELERKLQAGPPPELGKFQKIRWNSDMKQKIQAEKRQEEALRERQTRFFAPMDKLVDEMALIKSSLEKNATIEQVATAFAGCMANAKSVDTTKLIKDSSALSPEITALKDLFSELSDLTAQTFTEEQAKSYTARYHALGMEVNAAASRYLDEAGTKEPASCYVVLLHCVTQMLLYHLDALDADKVDTTEFSKLYALTTATGISANTMVLNQNYQDRRKNHLEHLAAEAAEKEREARNREAVRAARRLYLHSGTSAAGASNAWPLAPYAGIAERLLGEKLYTLSDQALGLEIQRMEENLEANTAAVHIFYREQAKGKPALERLQGLAIQEILLNTGDQLLTKQLESTSDVLLNALNLFTQDHAEELALYEKRLNQLKALPVLKQLSAALSCVEITNLIYSHEDPEAFAVAADSLQEQAQKNIDIAKALIAEKVTPKNQDATLQALINRNGQLLLLGARAVVYTETKHYLEYLHLFAPEVAYSEDSLRQKIQDAGIASCWISAVSKHLTDSNTPPDEEKQELIKLKDVIDANQKIFDTKTEELKKSSAQWQVLMQWQAENIILASNEFTQALQAFLLRDELQSDGDLTKSAYESGQSFAAPLTLKKNDVSNVLLLRGEALCHWSGFGGFLEEEENAVMSALEQALQEKLLPWAIQKNINALNDLDLLPLQEFTDFLTLLRSNIGKALVEWKNIDVLHPQEVRRRLLKALICGSLTKENISTHITEEEALLQKQYDAEKLRFLSFMGGNAPIKGEVRYLHLKDTKTTALTGERSRPLRRNERFQFANNIWDKIREENLEKVIHGYWVDACGQEAPVTHIQEKLKKDIRDLHSQAKAKDNSAKDIINEKIQQLNRLAELIKPAHSEDCQQEFMLRGMEDELLSFTKAGESFSSQERNDYDKTLLTLQTHIIPRYKKLDDTLKKVFGNNSDQVQIYHSKAKRLLTGLEPLDGSAPTAQQQERNRARFGVSSWEEALEKIYELIQPANTSLRQQAETSALLLEERTQQLKNYKGGVLSPFCNIILQNQEAFRALMTGEADGVAAYLSILEQQFHNPYEALRRYHPEGTFAREFIIEKQDLLWEKDHSLSFWVEEASAYYKAYCSYKIEKGGSIDDRYRALSASNQTLAPYLMQIIFANPEGISMLLTSDKTKLNSELEAFEKNIAQNSVQLDNFLRSLQDVKTLTLRTGFIMYLQTKIPFMKPADFQANLPKWWKDFQDLNTITQDEVKKSAQVLEKRAQVMLDIESKKQKGIEADQADQTSLKELQNRVKYAPSPVLLALGQNQSLSEKEFSTKKEEIYKAYSEQPAIIQDILLESSLFGTVSEQLAIERAWLVSTYEKIINTDFTVGKSSIRIDGDMAEELLMVSFAEWKKGISSSTNNTGSALHQVTKDTLQNTFLTLADCHRQLQELADIKLEDDGLLMERDHLVEALAAGMYSMDKKDFDALISRRTSYIKASALALTVFLEETAAYGKEQIALCSGLREYFHEDLLKGEGELNLPTLRKQAKELLKDKHIQQFLKDSSSLMEQISSTDEIKVTSSHHTLDQKHDLESYLSSSSDSAAFKAYSQLDLAQRQIFAMALGAPGQEELHLPTARFLKNEKLTTATRIQMQDQLLKYISHNTFTPVVDYTRALSQLKNPDGTINKQAFQRAMDFTNVITAQRLQQIPVDWDRLRDSASTYTVAKRLSGQTADPKQLTASSPEEFLEKIVAADMETSKAQSLKKELQALTTHQLQLLVHALTDRTILDRSTKITAKDRAKGVLHAYANSEKRAELMELLIHEPSIATQNALSSQTLSAALASLMSYQLRDDTILTGRGLHKNDFAADALERKTTIDWNLLSEALAFVQEVEQESLRLHAIKQADLLIQESKNEAAIQEYEIQKEAKLSTQEDFEEYLHTQAKKDGMAALYAGYQQLSQPQRALFVKALTQRHLLDISKRDINLNRLGLIERDYADAQSRNALLDEYVQSSLTEVR